MKHLIDITDLNVEEIDDLIKTAKDIIENKEKILKNGLKMTQKITGKNFL
ncbi:MAG: hypothetical protein ACI4UX_02750 [Clostridia bacterium]